ncbi:hypothetical protein CPB97_007979 [Podila verticillata]|nr:hypothetical protein CPB97_007979 [Podila verticillata]
MQESRSIFKATMRSILQSSPAYASPSVTASSTSISKGKQVKTIPTARNAAPRKAAAQRSSSSMVIKE